MEISKLDKLYIELEQQDMKLNIMCENYHCFSGDEIRKAKVDLENIKTEIRKELFYGR